MGHRILRTVALRPAAPRRLTRRPLQPPQNFRRRRHPLHRRLGRLRSRANSHHPNSRPRSPRSRRRPTCPQQPRPREHRLSTQRTRARHRHLVRLQRHHHRHRPRRRRMDGSARLLALGFLHQRANRLRDPRNRRLPHLRNRRTTKRHHARLERRNPRHRRTRRSHLWLRTIRATHRRSRRIHPHHFSFRRSPRTRPHASAKTLSLPHLHRHQSLNFLPLRRTHRHFLFSPAQPHPGAGLLPDTRRRRHSPNGPLNVRTLPLVRRTPPTLQRQSCYSSSAPPSPPPASPSSLALESAAPTGPQFSPP